jgi:hypothetical protein
VTIEELETEINTIKNKITNLIAEKNRHAARLNVIEETTVKGTNLNILVVGNYMIVGEGDTAGIYVKENDKWTKKL